MAQLFSLYHGKSKKKINTLLMTDTYKKCENHMNARKSSVLGFHEIRPAESEAKTYKKTTTTVGGNKCHAVPKINRHGQTSRPGWIGKHGFQQHT